MAIVLLQIGIFGLRDRVNVDGQRLRAKWQGRCRQTAGADRYEAAKPLLQ